MNLKYQGGQWDREEIRDSSLTKVTGQITLTGDYSNIRQFLYNLETAKEFVVAEKVELTRRNRQSDERARGEVGGRDLLRHGRGRQDGAGGGTGGSAEDQQQMNLLPPPGSPTAPASDVAGGDAAGAGGAGVPLRRQDPAAQALAAATAAVTQPVPLNAEQLPQPVALANSSRSPTSLRTRATFFGSATAGAAPAGHLPPRPRSLRPAPPPPQGPVGPPPITLLLIGLKPGGDGRPRQC